MCIYIHPHTYIYIYIYIYMMVAFNWSVMLPLPSDLVFFRGFRLVYSWCILWLLTKMLHHLPAGLSLMFLFCDASPKEQSKVSMLIRFAVAPITWLFSYIAPLYPSAMLYITVAWETLWLKHIWLYSIWKNNIWVHIHSTIPLLIKNYRICLSPLTLFLFF